MNKLLLKIIRHDLLVLFVLILGSAYLAGPIRHLQIRSDNEIFLDKKSQDYQEYLKFTEQFETDRILLLIPERESEEALKESDLSKAITDLSALKGIESIRTIPHQPPALLLRIHLNIGEKKRNQLIEEVQTIALNALPQKTTLTLAGVPYYEYLFFLKIQRDQKKLVPLVFATLCLLCLVFFKSALAIGISLTSILLTLLWGMGTMALCGKAINPLTSLLPPVIMVISLAHIIHILSFVSGKDLSSAKSTEQTLFQTFKTIGQPAFFAALTTCFGFASLLLSHNPAIIEFGQFATLASLYSFFISFSVSLILIKRFPGLAKRIHVRFPMSLLKALSHVLLNHRKKLFVLFVLLIAAAGLGLSHLKIDSTLVRFFKKNDSVQTSIQVLEQKFGGSSALEIIVHSPTPLVKNANTLKMLVQITQAFQDIPSVTLTPSVAELRARNLPSSFPFVGKNEQSIRWHATVHNASTDTLIQMEKDIEQVFNQNNPGNYTLSITGRDLLFAHMSHDLIDSQIKSLLLSSVLIGSALFITLQSLLFGLLGMLALIIPLTITYGLMGYLNIPLNTATVMISSIAMGLLVDDTIHFLHHFQKTKQLPTTLAQAGRAIIITSAILILGFSAGLSGQILPTIQFSGLMALVSALGLIINILFVPLLLPAHSNNKGAS